MGAPFFRSEFSAGNIRSQAFDLAHRGCHGDGDDGGDGEGCPATTIVRLTHDKFRPALVPLKIDRPIDTAVRALDLDRVRGFIGHDASPRLNQLTSLRQSPSPSISAR